MKTKSKTAFNGVVVLTAALIIIKILSALYRVPYQNILGDSGLYAYQQVYPLLALGGILSATAIPSATTQIFEAERSSARYTRMLKVVQTLGISLFIICFICAPWLTRLMGDPSLTTILRVASASFLFIGILGVCRAYYQSAQNMNPPAISQVIEQLIRVSIIFIAIGCFVKQDWTVYQAATLSIGGSVIGALGASVFFISRRPFKLTLAEETRTSIDWRHFFLAVVIFSVSQILVLLWQIVDSFTVIRLLKAVGIPFKEAIEQKGIFDRGPSFIQMGLIITTTFSFVLLPLLSKAVREEEHHLVSRYTNASLKVTILISTAAGVGLINLLPSLNIVFFQNNSLPGTLSVFMLTVICVSLIMMDIALLQVKQQEKTVLIGLGVGLCSKIIGNLLLIPTIHTLGLSVSTVLSLAIFAGILHRKVMQLYPLHRMKAYVGKLILVMLGMTIVVQVLMFCFPIHGRFSGLITLIISALAGIITTVILVVKLRLLSYKEVKHLPFGDKLYQYKRGRRQ